MLNSLRLRLILTSLVLGAVAYPLPTLAEVELKHFNEPIPVTIVSGMNTQTTPANIPFDFILNDHVRYYDRTLPKGTHLKGTVTEVQESRRLGRPAHYLVQFNEVVYPNDQKFVLDRTRGKDPREVTFRQFQRHTNGQLIKRQVLLGGLGTAISLPITLATSGGYWLYFAIGNAVKGTSGASVEVADKSPDDTRSGGKRFWVGALRGMTPLPLMAGLIVKSPNINYQPGQSIKARFNKDFWLTVFGYTRPTTATPIQTVMTPSDTSELSYVMPSREPSERISHTPSTHTILKATLVEPHASYPATRSD